MTDKDFAKEIKELKDNLDAAKTKQYKFEARMDELKKKRKRLLEELESCGVKPEELEEEIKNLEDKLQKLISEANELLPHDILNE